MQASVEAGTERQAALPFHYIVGQDADGHWLVVEARNRAGGLFRSRADAIRFAAAESGALPGAVEFAAAPLRLAL